MSSYHWASDPFVDIQTESGFGRDQARAGSPNMITRERETAGRDHKSEQPKHDMITRDSAVAAVAGALLRTAELVDPALPGWGGGGVREPLARVVERPPPGQPTQMLAQLFIN